MQLYQCPNCGRTYTEFENIFYCGTCNYRLVKKENVKEVKQPELSKREYHIIGEIPNPNRTVVECPYCHSTNTKKITKASKAVHTALFGIFSMGRNSKNFHCNKCGSDF